MPQASVTNCTKFRDAVPDDKQTDGQQAVANRTQSVTHFRANGGVMHQPRLTKKASKLSWNGQAGKIHNPNKASVAR
jgi:hypothetical protein